MTVLGIDPGTRRVGVAVSDAGDTVALPLAVVQRKDDDSYIEELVEIARVREADRIVVGLPRRLDGSDGPEAHAAMHLAKTLRTRLGLPVHLVDERFTTRIAEDALSVVKVSARRQRPVVDKVAATLLLQGFLDSDKPKVENT
ncbi:MAG: Holliday junction resolvase RuvX [Actinomycetota bacterium]